MTREEAIKEFESELKWAELNTYPYVSKQKIEADKMAINALEQEPILEKIRAEIDLLSDSRCDENTVTIYSWCGMKRRIFEIIDKYKAESEVQK